MVLLKLPYVNVTKWAAWERKTHGNLKISLSHKIQAEMGFINDLGYAAVRSAGGTLRW